MVNKVILIGNLGADPEARQTQTTTVVKLRLATAERRKDGEQWVDHTEWHRVVCFGRTAENVAKYCKKGGRIYVDGALRTTKWQDKDGKDQWSTEIVANSVMFLGSSGGDDRRSEPSRHEQAKVNGYQQGVDPGDDIPF